MCGALNGTPHSILAIEHFLPCAQAWMSHCARPSLLPNRSGPDHEQAASRSWIHMWLPSDRKEIFLLVIYWWAKSRCKCPFHWIEHLGSLVLILNGSQGIPTSSHQENTLFLIEVWDVNSLVELIYSREYIKMHFYYILTVTRKLFEILYYLDSILALFHFQGHLIYEISLISGKYHSLDSLANVISCDIRSPIWRNFLLVQQMLP